MCVDSRSLSFSFRSFGALAPTNKATPFKSLALVDPIALVLPPPMGEFES